MRGRAFLLPEGSMHYIAATPENPAAFAFVCFDPKHFLKAGNIQAQHAVELLTGNRQYFSGTVPEYLAENIQMISRLFDETRSSLPFASGKADCLLGELIINYYRSLYQNTAGEVRDGMEKIQQLVNRIRSHPEAGFPLADAAKNCGMSVSKFCRIFREYSGTTLTGYLIAARLKKAEELLRTTKMQIAVIALACGFNNLGYFHKIFKNYYNTTPYVLRNTFRQKGEFPCFLKEY